MPTSRSNSDAHGDETNSTMSTHRAEEVRAARELRMASLLAEICASSEDTTPSLSGTVKLMGNHGVTERRHLASLAVTAAYTAAGDAGEYFRRTDDPPGGIKFAVGRDDWGRAVFEFCPGPLSAADIDAATSRLAARGEPADHHIFITTAPPLADVTEYAATLYKETGGTEVAVLDCLGFLRHFLHLFHRRRAAFLDAYQALVLAEPESAVGQPLKEFLLVLSRNAVAEA